MKKLLIAAAFVIAAAPAYAEEINAVRDKDRVTIEQLAEMPDKVIVTGYDKRGALAYASGAKAENGSYSVILSSELSLIKVYDMEGTIYDVNMTVPNESEAPQISSTPVVTEAPTAAVKPTATRKPLNPSYSREIDQALAPGIVTNVASETNGGDDCCALTVLIQGEEVKVFVSDDRVIENVPSVFSSLKGEQAYSLRKGDVIYFRTNINGDEVRGIDLIYRPTDITKGTPEFSEFFNGGSSAGQIYAGNKLTNDRSYVFGIITDKANNCLTLYPADGKADKSFNIDYTGKTVTYIYDMSSKAAPYIASSNEIVKSSIPKSAYDDNDNITFSPEDEYNAALVRIVDKTAVDIIVFENIH